MNTPAAPTQAPLGSALRFILIGGLLGALQPLLLATAARWLSDTGAAGEPVNPLIAGAVASWRSILPFAVLGALVGKLAHAAHVKFGRDALLPIVLTYGFMSTAFLLFRFLLPE